MISLMNKKDPLSLNDILVDAACGLFAFIEVSVINSNRDKTINNCSVFAVW